MLHLLVPVGCSFGFADGAAVGTATVVLGAEPVAAEAVGCPVGRVLEARQLPAEERNLLRLKLMHMPQWLQANPAPRRCSTRSTSGKPTFSPRHLGQATEKLPVARSGLRVGPSQQVSVCGRTVKSPSSEPGRRRVPGTMSLVVRLVGSNRSWGQLGAPQRWPVGLALLDGPEVLPASRRGSPSVG